MKVYVRAPYSENNLIDLKNIFDEVIYEPWTLTGERFYENEMIDNLNRVNPDVLITELDRVTNKVLDSYKNLKLIGDCRSNPANIDINACNMHKLPVICTPGRNSIAVAEYIVGMIIMSYRNILPSIEWIKDGEWKEGTTPYYTWMGQEIYNKEVGIVGLGAVGKSLANLLTSFGANISYYDPYVKDIEKYKEKNLEDIFKESDIISIHLPVNSETNNMIDYKLLNYIKEGGILINSSRSQVINNNDLINIIKNKKITVILDVLPKEPPKYSELDFLKNNNVILTPHIGGATFQVTSHQSKILNERIFKWFKGEDLLKIIYNKEII
ncbi:NAD(P)-dependent oxidoreductase [Anaerococcus porci]|uniref:3-phosphoglycerate dehydrogenase n=1 Tax=Anaerococcus porci TaxID=2652269 RepID=A0A6N7VUM8_9FIRM|nr:NAD(P)-dependent oxidoreductase [Anaerococcus porci]MDY3006539.1 NAD(P)-dependent oxidoreductase [Anaerococcus porci]MSS77527.1 3-phosphoglycerate dehydrogenase [Anaerococcus porci]